MVTVGRLEEFDVNRPLTWDAYAERLEFYMEANGIIDEAKKTAVLLTVCGPKTYAIVHSLALPAMPSTKTYDELIAMLKAYFSPNPSEISQRFQFYRRNQRQDEGINAYIAELYQLAEHCNFGAYLELALRDRLVCGLRDKALQRRFFAEATLTFDQAREKALAAEAAQLRTVRRTKALYRHK